MLVLSLSLGYASSEQVMAAKSNHEGSSSPVACATTLLDLPAEVLRQCDLMPRAATHTAIDVRWLALCRPLLNRILAGLEPSHSLRLGSTQQSHSSWKSLQLLTQSFDDLHRVKVTIREGPVDMQLAALLATPLAITGSGKAWLANITHLSIQGDWQDASAVSPLFELIPDSVAVSCPSLTALQLAAVHIASQHQPQDQHLCQNQQQQQHHDQQQQQQQYNHKQQQQQQEETEQAMIDELSDWLLVDSEDPLSLSVIPAKSQPQQQQQQARVWPCQLQQQVGVQLSQLTLKSCLINMPPDAFKQQLQSFTRLKTLTVDGCMFIQCEPSRFYAAIVEAVSRQLVEFSVGSSQLYPPSMTALLSAEHPLLRRLGISGTIVEDSTLELLLQNFPCLADLSVQKFKLKASFARERCQWTQLSMAHVDVASLAHLPVVRKMSVKLMGTDCCFDLVDLGQGPQADLQRTAEAVAVVARYGGFLHFKGNASIDVDLTAPPHTAQVLIQTVHLLHNITAVTLYGAKVGLTLLSALGSCSSLRRVAFSARCAFVSGVFGDMLLLLPQVQNLAIDSHSHAATTNVKLADIVVLCTSANRPLLLELKSKQFHDEFKTWQEWLRGTLRGMVHNFVTLDIKYLS